MNQWTKKVCQFSGIPSVPHSRWLLSQGVSHDGVQIGSASRQTMAPSFTWGGSLSLSPKAVFFFFFLFSGKQKRAGWTGNKKCLSVICPSARVDLKYRYPCCCAFRLCSNSTTTLFVFFYHLAHLSCLVLTFQQGFTVSCLISNFLYLCSSSHNHYKFRRIVSSLCHTPRAWMAKLQIMILVNPTRTWWTCCRSFLSFWFAWRTIQLVFPHLVWFVTRCQSEADWTSQWDGLAKSKRLTLVAKLCLGQTAYVRLSTSTYSFEDTQANSKSHTPRNTNKQTVKQISE